MAVSHNCFEQRKSLNTIRSYVLRTTRMSDYQKKAYQRLKSVYCIPFTGAEHTDPLSWEAVFPHRGGAPYRPIILDIGFGMGDALAELAEHRRNTDFLGIEVHKPGVGKLLGEIESRSLENIRVVRYDAIPVCRYLIPPASLDGIHLFFPDPWPKKRHHKRRLVRPGFPEMVAPLLRKDGYLYMVTDWEDYAIQMLEILESSTEITNRYPGRPGAASFAPHQEWRPETAFERKGREKGHAIYELIFQRV